PMTWCPMPFSAVMVAVETCPFAPVMRIFAMCNLQSELELLQWPRGSRRTMPAPGADWSPDGTVRPRGGRHAGAGSASNSLCLDLSRAVLDTGARSAALPRSEE